MISICEDELICDMAEYYRIYDYRKYDALYIATLTFGLRRNSRVMMRLAEYKYTTSERMSFLIYDAVNWIKWSRSQAAQEPNATPPESLYHLLVEAETNSEKVQSFDTIDDFEAERRKRLEELRNA